MRASLGAVREWREERCDLAGRRGGRFDWFSQHPRKQQPRANEAKAHSAPHTSLSQMSTIQKQKNIKQFPCLSLPSLHRPRPRTVPHDTPLGVLQKLVLRVL